MFQGPNGLIAASFTFLAKCLAAQALTGAGQAAHKDQPISTLNHI